MKRYYDEYGEPDVAKTIWAFLNRCLLVLAIFMGFCIVWEKTNQPEPIDRTPHWKNWDNTRSLSEVKWYDYENGIIHYRDEEPYNIHQDRFIKSPQGYSGDGLVIRADGVSVYMNISAEELLDQLTEDADFYEYFERNMD